MTWARTTTGSHKSMCRGCASYTHRRYVMSWVKGLPWWAQIILGLLAVILVIVLVRAGKAFVDGWRRGGLKKAGSSRHEAKNQAAAAEVTGEIPVRL